MPESLQKALPHCWDIDPTWTKTPANDAYQMAFSEIAELRKHLNKILATGFLRPAKAPYGAVVLFEKKKDRTIRLYID